MLFQDRQDAGRQLAERLAFLKKAKPESTIILAIPRGGVVVGAEIARVLGAPLDVYITRKLGAPGNEELAIGAVAPDGGFVIDEELVRSTGADERYVMRETARQRQEIERRMARYRGDRPLPELAHKTVILVDDGVATGATVLAALRAIRKQTPAKLIVAVPVGPPDTIERLGKEADQVVCLATPDPFWAVGAFYADWPQTTDEEVVSLLSRYGGT